MRNNHNHYETVSETEEWYAFDDVMALLRNLKIISNDQYQDFPDREFMRHLLSELKDMHCFFLKEE
jgi:hypothetical protein